MKVRTFTLSVPPHYSSAPIVLAFPCTPTLERIALGICAKLGGAGGPDLEVVLAVLEGAGITDAFLAREFEALELSELPWPSIEKSGQDGSAFSLQLVDLELEDYVREFQATTVAARGGFAQLSSVRILLDGSSRPWLVLYTRNPKGEELEIARMISAFLPHLAEKPHPLTDQLLAAVDALLAAFELDPTLYLRHP